VLAICESARYAPSSPDLNASSARAVADDMQQIFDAGSRL
jgi:hypothetical protein